MHSRLALLCVCVIPNLLLSHTMATASSAFSMNIPIDDVQFYVDGVWVPISRVTRTRFDSVPSGTFGHVFPACYLGDSVAFKLLPSKPGVSAVVAHEAFMAEAENMLAVRGMTDRARVLQRVGAPLSEPCELRDASRMTCADGATLSTSTASARFWTLRKSHPTSRPDPRTSSSWSF